MSKSKVIIRWLAALVAAAVAYLIVIYVVPTVGSRTGALSSSLLVFGSSILATAAGLSAGVLVAPREQLQRARFVFFWIGLLVPAAITAWGHWHGSNMDRPHLTLLAGALVGGLLGLFAMILPKPRRAAQPRRFT